MAATIKKTRAELVAIAKSFAGVKQGSAKHHELVDTFNKKHPHNHYGNYSCPWCAISNTAWYLLCGLTDKQVPMDYNCGTLIEDAKKLGIWKEDDNYLPAPGDSIIYNWSDSGKGQCNSGASHVGMIVSVKGSKIRVIEGNMSTTKKVGYRDICRNQRYIRGYIAPEFLDKETSQKITVDGIWGPDTIKLTQEVIGVPVDGVAGAKTWKAIQKQCGLKGKAVDGKPGINTYKAMQHLLGIKQTGKFNTTTIKAWQKWLNKQVD